VKDRKGTDIVLRPKRQITLPRAVCDKLGIKSGDVLEIIVQNSSIIATPRKTHSMNALEEIHRAFQSSGISEKELIDEGKRVRKEIFREKNG